MLNTRKFGLPLMVALLLVLVFASTGSAEASARDATWTVAVTYQNVGDAPASLVVNFFAEGDSTPIFFDPLNGGTLAPGAGRSFWIGNVAAVSPGFNGNAVISSDQPMSSTVVQFSNDPGFRMRLLYTGFQAQDASDQFLVPTVLLNKWSRTAVFSIQNTEAEDIIATVRFFDADNNGNASTPKDHTILANSSKFIEMDDPSDTGLGSASVYNGSAIVTAVFAPGTPSAGDPAKVVAAANEYYVNSNVATSYEGLPVSKAANEVFVATGLCERYSLDTFYAVSNSGLSGNATITVDYFNTNGSPKASDGPYVIGPGQKRSIFTCNPSDSTNMSNFTGSAVVTSVGNPVVVMGKAQNSINAGSADKEDVLTAFLGEPGGGSKRAISFVRWANDAEFNDPANNGAKQRTYIAIQNLGDSTAIINAKYYDKNGVLVATHPLTIAASSKGNTDANMASALGAAGMRPGSFGYYTDNSTGGAVILEADASNPTAKFIAISRVQHPGAGEDANALPVN